MRCFRSDLCTILLSIAITKTICSGLLNNVQCPSPGNNKKKKAFSHPKCGQVRSEMPSATLLAVDWLGLLPRMEAWIGAAAAAHSNSIRFVDNRDETGEVRPFATVTLYCLHRNWSFLPLLSLSCSPSLYAQICSCGKTLLPPVPPLTFGCLLLQNITTTQATNKKKSSKKADNKKQPQNVR